MHRRSHPLIKVLTCVLGVPTCAILTGALVLPDGLDQTALSVYLKPWLEAGAMLAASHLLLRPVMRLFSAPIGCITLGLSGFAIDIGLYLLSIRLCGYAIAPDPITIALTALLINIICLIASDA